MYRPDGSIAVGPISDTLPPEMSATYFLSPHLGLPSDADLTGSLTVQTKGGRIVTLANLVETNYIAGGASIGQTSGSSTVRLPLLQNNNSGYYSWFSVQNVGNVETTVTVAYSDRKSVSRAIKAQAAQPFFQILEGHGTNRVFSAKVTASQPLVVTVVQETLRNMLVYTGFGSAGSPYPVFPLINANNSGYFTGIQIQNNGSSSTNVTVSYSPAPNNGTACSETRSIAANSSTNFALAVFAIGESDSPDQNSNCIDGAKFVGSAKVIYNSTGQNLTAVVNQANTNGPVASSYGGFDAGTFSSRVVMPLIMDRNSGWWTGFNIQHVGGPASNVTCTFSGTSYAISQFLNEGGVMNYLQNNQIGTGYVGAGDCIAANPSTRIVGIVNELGPNGLADQLLTYEAINVNP